MDVYRMRNCEVEAEVIDAQWLTFLAKERGITGVHVGDYWVRCIDGIERVIDKKSFERIFCKVEKSALEEFFRLGG